MNNKTFFCIGPTLRNIGNDIINYSTKKLLIEVFGKDSCIVGLPAIEGRQFGGFTSKQVYDANRLADAVVVGGGNLFENGQLTINRTALDALNTPLFIMGISHGRIYDKNAEIVNRSDAMPVSNILQLNKKAHSLLVRDYASKEILDSIGCNNVEVGGCPTMFLPPNSNAYNDTGDVLISLRHPSRMSVTPSIQWHVAEDLRRLIKLLQNEYGKRVKLLCHDYIDIEFAAAFPEVPYLYFDDVTEYMDVLKNASLNVTYRLHAFLPCVSFGTPTIHLSYDERGRAMIKTAQMSDWDLNLNDSDNFIDKLMDRIENLDSFFIAREKALKSFEGFKQLTVSRLKDFKKELK